MNAWRLVLSTGSAHIDLSRKIYSSFSLLFTDEVLLFSLIIVKYLSHDQTSKNIKNTIKNVIKNIKINSIVALTKRNFST